MVSQCGPHGFIDGGWAVALSRLLAARWRMAHTHAQQQQQRAVDDGDEREPRQR